MHSERPAGIASLCLRGASNDGTLKKCRADFKYYKNNLAQSAFYRNAEPLREMMTATSHLMVMVGPANSEIWKLSPE